MISAIPPRLWADSAGQGGSAGSAEMRIGLLATLRDESQALPRFFALLEALEADPRVERLFCSFYENDSSDDTPEYLAAWLMNRPGVLQSERLGAPRLHGREISRTMRMAEARNKALAGFADERLDWLVVIDADLYSRPRHIWQLIEVLQRDRGVAMACASALQNLPDIFGRSPWSYYDSFALIDQGGRQGMTGARVPLWDLDDRAAWMAGRPVSVLSAFGGIAVLPMELHRRHRLQWQGDQGCEHWAFCMAAGQAGRVLACPEVSPLVIHADNSIAWHPTYPDRSSSTTKRVLAQSVELMGLARLAATV